jgi:hypothetical protein
LIGRAIRGVGQLGRRLVIRTKDPAAIFSDELALWDLAGFTYGRYLYSQTPAQRASAAPPLQFQPGKREILDRSAEESPLGRAVCSNR